MTTTAIVKTAANANDFAAESPDLLNEAWYKMAGSIIG